MELHRWCQWISRYHPGGVYAGEESKRQDYVSSLPPYLLTEVLKPALARGERAAVFAEEWHTVDAVLHLDWLLREAGLRERVCIFWNANNTFGFHTIDWPRLARAATLTRGVAAGTCGCELRRKAGCVCESRTTASIPPGPIPGGGSSFNRIAPALTGFSASTSRRSLVQCCCFLPE